MTKASNVLSRCGQIAQERDPDRFLLAMLAPVERREDLFALLAFNHEIAKTRDRVSEPMLGQIRLQWWREAIDECFQNRPRRHEVVLPLNDAIHRHDLPRNLFFSLIDNREQDLGETEFRDGNDLQRYALASGGVLAELSVITLSGDHVTARAAARHLGAAWAMVGLMRAMPFHLQQRRITIPQDMIHRHDISRNDLQELRPSAAMFAAVKEICDLADQEIASARAMRRQLPKESLPVLHLATLCRSHITQLRRAGYNPFSTRLANKPGLRVLHLLINNMLGRF